MQKKIVPFSSTLIIGMNYPSAEKNMFEKNVASLYKVKSLCNVTSAERAWEGRIPPPIFSSYYGNQE